MTGITYTSGGYMCLRARECIQIYSHIYVSLALTMGIVFVRMRMHTLCRHV